MRAGETGANVIAVDVGGTHTDAALLSASGTLHVHKVRSTPADPGVAFLEAVEGLLASSGLRAADIDAVVHGTTVVTNAVISGDFARVGLIVTAGFEDILEIGTQQRVDLYDPWLPKAPALVPRERVRGVRERVGSDGSVVDPLDESDVRAAARALAGAVDAIAVSLLFSFASPAHERRTEEILRQELPGVPVCVSSVVAPEFREFPRAATTVLNAALLPVSGDDIARLGDRLRGRGVAGAFQLMTSSGGVIPAALAARLPVALLVSGPAAGAVAAAEIGRRLGEPDVVMLDVGGTSADVAVIVDGAPQHRYHGEVAGMPVTLPQIDVLPIGAGGGSIATVDDFGSLSVGPDSAGADPGPAAYGVGLAATTTDAHIVRGSLDPRALLGGGLPLDAERALDAVTREVAAPLRLAPAEGAASIIRIADGRMADALRAMTVARGIDIRRFALIAFGGAGPLHACGIAEDLGMRRVLVPRYPGLTSALGLLMGDGRYDVARTHISPLRALDHDLIQRRVAELVDDATAAMRDTGVSAELTLRLDVDLRYAGQAYELTVPAPTVGVRASDVPELEAAFARTHREVYGHAWDEAPIELVTLRVRAETPRASGRWRTIEPAAGLVSPGSRDGWNARGEAVRYAVLDRADVSAGLRGPAIITQTDTTTLLPRGWLVQHVDGAGMVLDREEQPCD